MVVPCSGLGLSGLQVNVQLPLPVEKAQGDVYTPQSIGKINDFLRYKLLEEWKTSTAHFYHNGAWWCRCSAQVFNEVRGERFCLTLCAC